MSEPVIFNEFVRVLGEWIAVHDEHLHFDMSRADLPQAKYASGAQYIHANQAFKKLPEFVKECIVAHEIGHRELKHGGGNWLRRLYAVNEGIADKNEHEADLYGAGLIGFAKFIEALKYCRDIFAVAGQKLSAKEFELRIKALQTNLQ